MGGSDTDIILNEVVYRTLGGDRAVTVYGATYIGIIDRKSDLYTCLSMRKLGASRAFNIEVGALVSVRIGGSTWYPQTPSNRWRLREAELRDFIEGCGLPDWAHPYFDPSDPKYHGRHITPDWSQVEPSMTIEVRVAATFHRDPGPSTSMLAALQPWDTPPRKIEETKFLPPGGTSDFARKISQWKSIEVQSSLTQQEEQLPTEIAEVIQKQLPQASIQAGSHDPGGPAQIELGTELSDNHAAQRRGILASLWSWLKGKR